MSRLSALLLARALLQLCWQSVAELVLSLVTADCSGGQGSPMTMATVSSLALLPASGSFLPEVLYL